MAKGKCQLCGVEGYTESHHIIHGKKGKARWDADWNRIDLCLICHRRIHDNDGRKELYQWQQSNLLARLPEWATDKPGWISDSDWWQIIKLLRVQEQGYHRDDIVKRIMGDRYY